MLQHLADGRVDLMLGRGNTGPVYPWFGQDIRDGIPLDRELRCCRLWREDVVDWEGRFRTRCRASPRRRARSTACRRSSGTARSAARRSPSRPPTTATASSTTTSSGRRSTPSGWSGFYRRRFEHRGQPRRPGDRRAGRAGVHAAQQPGRRPGVPAVLRRRARLRAWPVAGGLQPGDAADRRQPAAGHRADPGLPRLRRRLPAPAVPRRPRRAAARRPCSSSSTSSARRSCRCCAGSSPLSSPRTCPKRRHTRRWSRPRASATRPSMPRRRRGQARAASGQMRTRTLAVD